MSIHLTREFYIPKGATKVADRHSDAVAYVASVDAYCATAGKVKRPHAVVFFGRQTIPVANYTYGSPAECERAVRRDFERRQKSLAFKAQQQAERKAEGRGLEVGDIVTASWGYEQTQVQAFQVTALIGKTMVELRSIACATVPGTEGRDCDRVQPVKDAFVTGKRAETHRKVAKGGHVTLDSVRGGSKWTGGSLHRSWYY